MTSTGAEGPLTGAVVTMADGAVRLLAAFVHGCALEVDGGSTWAS
jgi:hypothetical protein